MQKLWYSLMIVLGTVALLGSGCTGGLSVNDDDVADDDATDDDDDDDDVTDDDDDDVTDDDDDDVTDDDDDDDDDVTDDDDDDTTADDDDDDTTEACCTDLSYPGFVFDSLTIAEFLESSLYDAFLSTMLEEALPPDYDDVIILYDPNTALENVNSYDASFGIGMVDQDLWSWDPNASAAVMSYELDANRDFVSTDEGETINLSFGVTVPLYNTVIDGTYSQDFQEITAGAISGAITEADIVDIEVPPYGTLLDLIDDREMTVDLDGDGTMDAWTFRMEFTAFQFVP